jgi:alpha-beta hydrolase superfamily lysophospholipase
VHGEWADLAAAVDYARSRGAQHVVLVGASMGGAIVASYLRHAPADGIVKGVVLDSPALSLERTVQWGADQIALPGGLSLPPPVTWGAKRFTTLRTGLDWEAVDYVSDPSWDTVPTLVFHGPEDRTVPVDTSGQLARARANVTYVETAGADQVESWNVDPAAYERTLAEFLGPLVLTD